MPIGKLKSVPDDFLVAEVLMLPPDAPAPTVHLYTLRKCGYTTFEATRFVADWCGLEPHTVGYAGLKDEDGITEQHVSVQRRLTADESAAIESASRARGGAFIALTYLRGGNHPLSVGRLAGNNFRLVIRDLDETIARALHGGTRWTFLFVNYYGPQRFGLPSEPKSTPQIGGCLIGEDWAGALELVRALGDDTGCRARSHHGEPRRFFDTLDPRLTAFYQSSYHSLDWNERLRRITGGICGGRHRTEAHDGVDYLFPVDRGQTLELLRRCREMEYVAIRASGGTLTAASKMRSTVVPVRVDRHDLFADTLNPGRWACELSFFLPTGCYATVALPQFLAELQSGTLTTEDADGDELTALYGIAAEVPNWRPVCGWGAVAEERRGEAALFRSGLPSRVTAETAQRMRSWLGVTCYLDLRTEDEVRRAGEPAGLASTLEWRQFPIASSDGLRGIAVPTHEDYARDYIRTLEDNAVRFASLLTFLAQSEHRGYAIGCRAGKDRTGIALMLLLSAAGASREAILADYASSSAPLARDVRHFAESWEKRGLSASEYRERHLLADRRAMEAACGYLDERHRGAAAFLTAHGLAPESLNRLREKFTRFKRPMPAPLAANEAGSGR